MLGNDTPFVKKLLLKKHISTNLICNPIIYTCKDMAFWCLPGILDAILDFLPLECSEKMPP